MCWAWHKEVAVDARALHTHESHECAVVVAAAEGGTCMRTVLIRTLTLEQENNKRQKRAHLHASLDLLARCIAFRVEGVVPSKQDERDDAEAPNVNLGGVPHRLLSGRVLDLRGG